MILKDIKNINPLKYLNIRERNKYFFSNTLDSSHEQYYTKWLQRTLLSELPENVEAKLTELNITKATFTRLLNPEITLTNESIEDIQHSDWYQVYKEGLKIIHHNKKEDNLENIDITLAFQPFARWAWVKLQELVKPFRNIINIQTFTVSCLNSLVNNLTKESLRSIVLELHIEKLRETLKGDTSEERFNDFIKKKFLNEKEIQNFYDEYVVLTRILSLKTLYFVQNIKEFLERYTEDKIELTRFFKLDEKEILESIISDLGDTHKKGHTVMLLKFSSGREIFYKPKSLVTTICFQRLLDWVNEKHSTNKLKYHKCLDKNDYGWEEKIVPKDCQYEYEVEQYYENFGALVCIIHFLKGCDIHLENIIASKDMPYVIDLETILHQYVPFSIDKNAEFKAKDIIAESVLGTALLPMMMFKNSKQKGIDMSALNGREQKVPFKVLQLKSVNTDEMNFVYDYGKSISGNNIPQLFKKTIEISKYTKFIHSGFEQIYNLFLENKEELLSKNSPLKQFKNINVRIIARNTQTYANFLQESTHPDYTRDFLEREILFDRLWFYPFKEKKIIQSEIEDLLEGDIPFFSSNTSSTSLIDSRGRIIHNVFETSSYDAMIKLIHEISGKTKAEQLELLDLSVAKLSEKATSKYTNQQRTILIKQKEVDYQELLIISKKIAEDLKKRAIFSDDYSTVTWISKQTLEDGSDSISPISSNFYNGILGIALFYLHIGELTNNSEYRRITKACINTATQSLSFNSFDEISAYYGMGSLIAPLYQYQKLTGDSTFKPFFKKYMELIEEHFTNDKNYDFLSGTSGLINVFVSIYEETKDKKFLELANRMGEYIIKNTYINQDVAILKSNYTQPLGGFSHGSSGFAYTFARMAQYDSKYANITNKFLNFDRSLWDESIGGWIDVRKQTLQDSMQWCHGSTGIGLSRILLKSYINDPLLDVEIHKALDNILHIYQKSDNGLCHGNMGDTELFLMYSLMTGENKYKSYGLKIAKNVLNSLKFNTNKYSQDISLFNGLAGIGYQSLRLYSPTKIPSVFSFHAF